MTEHEKEQNKRLFFGFEVHSPWPQKLPSGRMVEEYFRHMTVIFLGSTDYSKLKSVLSSLPLPPFAVGLVGKFNECLFLPPRHPRVVAWHIDWAVGNEIISKYYWDLVEWFKAHGFEFDIKEKFLSHVTICREPFNPNSWRKAFVEMPMMIKNFHLYESIGQLKYQPCWTYPILAPFEEIEHTADIAFRICGENLDQIHANAQTCLAFTFPPILSYFSSPRKYHGLEDIIIDLNEVISRADGDIGTPFKAVSYHGKLFEVNGHPNVLEWEMIVDV